MTAPADFFKHLLPQSARSPVSMLRALPLAAFRLRLAALALMLTGGLAMVPAAAFAQAVKPAAPASATLAAKLPALGASGANPKVAVSRPAWAELNPMQQQALKPLAPSWNAISDGQKRKWLEISKNFPSLTPDGQTTMHSRMDEWVKLSPQERAQARLNFGKSKELSKELTPEEKKAKWETYQALSAEEKQKLAAKASPKPTGAAPAIKPVAPQKLAAVPPHPAASGVRPAAKITPVSPTPPGNPAALRAGEMPPGVTAAPPQR